MAPRVAPARLASLDGQLGVLSVALAQWQARDDTLPQPGIRRAANDAIDAIDELLHELHELRARVIGEICGSDDAAIERADALLDRLRERAP